MGSGLDVKKWGTPRIHWNCGSLLYKTTSLFKMMLSFGHPTEHNPKITTTFYPWSSSWHQANHILLAEDPMTYRTIQSSWQGHAFQALVKPTTKCQGLKRVWQVHSFQTPIETFSKCQGLKRVWQVHSFQTPSRLRLKHSPNVKV